MIPGLSTSYFGKLWRGCSEGSDAFRFSFNRCSQSDILTPFFRMVWMRGRFRCVGIFPSNPAGGLFGQDCYISRAPVNGGETFLAELATAS